MFELSFLADEWTIYNEEYAHINKKKRGLTELDPTNISTKFAAND